MIAITDNAPNNLHIFQLSFKFFLKAKTFFYFILCQLLIRRSVYFNHKAGSYGPIYKHNMREIKIC